MKHRAPALGLTEERGFSMLEMLVASSMSVMVVGGMLLMLDGLRDVHRDQQQLIDAQMTARIAIEQMQRDIQLAGIGLLGMLSPFPVIEPRADGGVDIRYNSANLTARLTADMGGVTGNFVVDTSTGFAPEMFAIVYDGTGASDLVLLTGASNGVLSFAGAVSKAYRVADGAAVKRVQTISYQLQAAGGALELLRQEDNDAAQPVAFNVRSMTITYLDDADPPLPFTPATTADQQRVSAVEVTIVVETEDVRLNTTAERTVTLRTRITPRSAMLAS